METTGISYEILFSDDGSRDGSADTVRALGLSNVRVVGYESNRGKGCAVRTAMLAAEGDAIMFTDADLAYGTEVIKRVYDIFSEKPTDIVIGSRNIHKDGYEGYTLLRRIVRQIDHGRLQSREAHIQLRAGHMGAGQIVPGVITAGGNAVEEFHDLIA